MNQRRAWRATAAIALVLAASGWPLAAVLYVDNRKLANLTCEEQNNLRVELNNVLDQFEIPPKFFPIDCS